MLHNEKGEIIIFGSRNNLEKLPSISPRVGYCKITCTKFVRTLGAYFDSLLNMEEFILKTCRACQFQIYKIARVRKYPSKDTFACLVQGLVFAQT